MAKVPMYDVSVSDAGNNVAEVSVTFKERVARLAERHLCYECFMFIPKGGRVRYSILGVRHIKCPTN